MVIRKRTGKTGKVEFLSKKENHLMFSYHSDFAGIISAELLLCFTVSHGCIKMKIRSFICWACLTKAYLFSLHHPHVSQVPLFCSLSLILSLALSHSLTHSSSESTLIIAVSHMFSPLPPPRPFSPTPPVLFLWCWRQVGHRQLEDCFHSGWERQQ